MKQLVKQVRRLISRRGESLLSSAVGDLDKLAVKLEKAEQQLAVEIQHENEDIAATREQLAIREARSQAALKTLDANRQRSRRIYDRVAGFVA
jgi:hypothetical protein